MILTVTQYTDEWYKARLGKFTASDAQVIYTAGKGLETLCFEKAAELITGEAKTSYTNADMDRGSELEMEARNGYELETGNPVEQTGLVVLNDLPQVGCSPDGLVAPDGLIEVKCPNDVIYAKFMFDNKIDPKYFAQMQMQMFITKRSWCDLIMYNPNFPSPITILRVKPDDKFIVKLVEGIGIGITKLNEIMDKLNANQDEKAII